MSLLIEASRQNKALFGEFKQLDRISPLDRADRHDYWEPYIITLNMQTEHLLNTSVSLVQFAQNLLNSTRAQCQ